MNIENKNIPENWKLLWMEEIKKLYGADVYEHTNILGCEVEQLKTCVVKGVLKNKSASLTSVNATFSGLTDPDNSLNVSKTYDVSQTVSLSLENHNEQSTDLGVTADLGIAGDLFSLSTGGSYNITTSVGSSQTQTKDKTESMSSNISYNVEGPLPIYEVWLNVISEMENGIVKYLYTPLNLKLEGQGVKDIDVKKVLENVGQLNFEASLKLSQLIRSLVIIPCDNPENLLEECVKKLNLSLDIE